MVVKLGRNDLCPCGSGKKYKKCCSNTVEFVDVNLEKDLLAVEMDFIRWATRNYKTEIDELMAPYYKQIEIHEEAKQTFNFFSYLWYFSSVKQDGKFIWELYIETNPEILKSERILNIVQSWIDVPPSVFIVKNWAPNQNVIVENIFTKEVQWVKSLQDHHSAHENGIGLGLGTVLPVENGHTFFMTFFYVPEELEKLQLATEQIKAMSEATAKDPYTFLAKSFMGVLEFLMLGTPIQEAVGRNLLSNDLESTTVEQSALKESAEQEINTAQSEAAPAVETVQETVISENEIENEVLEAFTAYAQGSQKNVDFINKGIDLWTTYCIKENPILRKPQVAAAALYYLVDSFGAEKGITQSQLAKDFFISSTSISSRFKVLQTSLKDEIAELTSSEVATV